MKKQILLTPGPTPIPPEVREALARPMLHHRTAEYQEIFKETVQGLKEILKTQKSDVFLFASSGTGVMEAAVVNFLSPGDKVVAVVGGKFGERWEDLCKAYGLETVVLPVTWGEACNPKKLEELLGREKEVKAVFTTLCETSTGARNDIESLAKVTHAHGSLIAVDAISGLAADPLWTDRWGVDIVIGGSQKALMIPPGLGLISVGEQAWKRAASARLPRFYFDLSKARKALEKWDTPFTPAISLVVSLRESIGGILKKGIEKVWQETGQLADETRKALTHKLGLSLFARHPSNALSAVKVPEGMEGGELIQALRQKHGIWVADGQGSLKGKLLRIAHMGYIQKKDIQLCLSALEKELKEVAHETFN